MGRKRDVVQRFWEKVTKTDGCWLWTAALDKDGYGKFKARSYTLIPAHRFSFELHVGDVPQGLFVCHSCDNRRCVRPDHFFLGTALDNNHDMQSKGRHRYGIRVKKTHCKYGHERDTKRRWCRLCHNERQRRIRMEQQRVA